MTELSNQENISMTLSKPAMTEGHSFNDTSSYKLKAYDCSLVDTRQQQQQQQQK